MYGYFYASRNGTTNSVVHCSSMGQSYYIRKGRKGITDSGDISERKSALQNIAFRSLLNKRFRSKVTPRFLTYPFS